VAAHLRAFVQYIIILSVTALLIWFSLRGLQVSEGENKWDYIYKTWQAADKGWLFLMAGIAIISHMIRAERWKILMKPTGYKITLTSSFLSVMVGYLVNLVIPRGGEVSRCYNLYKLEKSPVEVSFGTVVVERLIDVFFLLLLIAIAFVAESKKLFAFIDTLPIQSSGLGSKLMWLSLVAMLGIIILFIIYQVAKRNQKLTSFFQKTLIGFKEGLVAIVKLENKSLFIFYSILIWVLYFVMSYCVIMAFHETSSLGISAVLSLFAIGSIAMAVPLPGGTGSYHALVPAGLVFLYNIPKADAIAFTFVFHGWQTLIMVVGGALSLIVTSILVRRKRLHP